MTIFDPHRDRTISLTLWYPAQSGGTPIFIGDNAVFLGEEAQENARIAEGIFPAVLVSHGGLRSASHLSGWLASRLADQGFLAIAVEGPRIDSHDAKRAIAEIWERPADLSLALTVLAKNPFWSKHINFDRIAALGFFLGGTSTLSLAGGRLNAGPFQHSCDHREDGPDCDWFLANGMDLKDVDTQKLTRDNGDRRIRVAIAVNPEYAGSFSPESLGKIAIPVGLIHLGNETTAPGRNARGLELALKNATFWALPEASSFDAFSFCKPGGAMILSEEEGNKALCGDTNQVRSAIHQKLVAFIVQYLQERFRSLP